MKTKIRHETIQIQELIDRKFYLLTGLGISINWHLDYEVEAWSCPLSIFICQCIAFWTIFHIFCVCVCCPFTPHTNTHTHSHMQAVWGYKYTHSMGPYSQSQGKTVHLTRTPCLGEGGPWISTAACPLHSKPFSRCKVGFWHSQTNTWIWNAHVHCPSVVWVRLVNWASILFVFKVEARMKDTSIIDIIKIIFGTLDGMWSWVTYCKKRVKKTHFVL